MSAACGLLVAALMAAAHRQTAYWRDSETLWTRAMVCSESNATAHYNLGVMLAEQGRAAEAIAHFQESLKIQPRSADAHNNLGVVLAMLGRIDEAAGHFQKALQIQPDYPDARRNLGMAMALTRKNNPPRLP